VGSEKANAPEYIGNKAVGTWTRQPAPLCPQEVTVVHTKICNNLLT